MLSASLPRQMDRPRSRHTAPATAPRMITTPIAMSQDMRANTTPINPYFLSSPITVLEKMYEKTTSMPIQQIPVAMAEGSRADHEILPANRNHIVNHQ